MGSSKDSMTHYEASATSSDQVTLLFIGPLMTDACVRGVEIFQSVQVSQIFKFIFIISIRNYVFVKLNLRFYFSKIKKRPISPFSAQSCLVL